MIGDVSTIQNIIRQNIGIATDTASITGNLNEKIAYLNDYLPARASRYVIQPSDDILVSDTGTETTLSTNYLKVKEVLFLTRGRVRVKFDMYAGSPASGGTVYGRIYINGVAAGTERAIAASVAETTYTEDFNLLNDSSTVELWIKQASAGGVYVNDYKICGVAVDNVYGIVTT